VVATPVFIPAAHIENLLAAGYIQESVSGLALTTLVCGALIENGRRRKGADVALRGPEGLPRNHRNLIPGETLLCIPPYVRVLLIAGQLSNGS
jgi:hypothetical protein